MTRISPSPRVLYALKLYMICTEFVREGHQLRRRKYTSKYEGTKTTSGKLRKHIISCGFAGGYHSFDFSPMQLLNVDRFSKALQCLSKLARPRSPCNCLEAFVGDKRRNQAIVHNEGGQRFEDPITRFSG